MEAKKIVKRIGKLGAAAGCGYAAFVCAWGASYSGDHKWYAAAAGCATAAGIMFKQAVFGYREEQ